MPDSGKVGDAYVAIVKASRLLLEAHDQAKEIERRLPDLADPERAAVLRQYDVCVGTAFVALTSLRLACNTIELELQKPPAPPPADPNLN